MRRLLLPLLVLTLSSRSWGQDGGQAGVPVDYFEVFSGLVGDAGASDEEVAAFGGPTASQVLRGLGLASYGWTEVGPSCVVPVLACVEKGKRVVALEAENADLRGNPGNFSFKELMTGSWIGFALGALTAVAGIAFGCWSFTGSIICSR